MLNASMTKARSFSRRSMDSRPNLNRESHYVIGAVIPNLLLTCAKRCSMKPDP
jgi:hypothetical protein